MIDSLNPVTITLAGDDDSRDMYSGLLMALREFVIAATAGQEESSTPLEYARGLVRRTCDTIMATRGAPLHVLLAPSAPLVDGACLLAPRWVHELSQDLRERLADTGISELFIHGEPDDSDLDELAEACREADGDARRSDGMLRWGPVEPIALVRGVEAEPLSPEEHAFQAISTAAASWSRVERLLRGGAPGAALRLRRLSGMIAGIPLQPATSLLRAPSIRTRLAYSRERAALRALLAAVLLHRVGAEALHIVETVMAALAIECLSEPRDQDTPPPHPSAIARALAALALPGDDSVLRAAIAFEASWLARPDLGPLHAGAEPPCVHAAIVHAAWRCMRDPAEDHVTGVNAIVSTANDDLARAVAKLVASTLGVTPRWPVLTRKTEALHVGPRTAAVEDARPTPIAPSPDQEQSEPPDQRPPQRPQLFSEEDMDDIASDLLGDSLPPMPTTGTVRPKAARRTSRPAPRKRPTVPPGPAAPPVALVPGSLIDDSERRAKALAAFRSAEEACAEGNFEGALGQADAAVMLVPQNPAYIALQAYLEALDRKESAADFDDLIQRVERAFLGSSPDARAQYWRGMLLRNAGKTLAARQAFRKGLELSPEDPDLQDAVNWGSLPPEKP